MPLNGNNPILAVGPQPPQPEEKPSALGAVALGAAGVGAAGFLPVGQKRLWDYYLSGIRGVEAGFPAAILRTFRVSEALSPFETWSRFDLSQEVIKSRSIYGQYLRQMLGEETLSATVFRKKGVFGEIVNREGKAIGVAASIASGTQRGETIADYYARLAGVPVDETLSIKEGALRARWQAERVATPYSEWVKKLPFSERQPRIPLIAPYRKEVELFGKKVKLNPTAQRAIARAEVFQRFARAKAATTMGRLNTLLRKPFEVAGVGKVLGKIPLISGIGGKPGSAASMMGGYVKKGMIAGGALTALSYYDYLRSQGGPAPLIAGPALGGILGGVLSKRHGRPFSTKGAIAGAATGLLTAVSPRFDEGLFHGALSVATDLNVARAKLSQKLGLQKSVRRQEEVTPGLLSVKTAAGFAGAGALGAGLVGYGKLLQTAVKEKVVATRKPFEEIFSRLRSDWYGEGDEIGKAGKWIQQNIGRRLKKVPLVGGRLAKIKSPMAMGAIGGTALWLAASTALPLLSGNVGAAIPGVNLLATEETPEELQAVYSGEKEVPVRKGRFWEMGRSTPYEGGQIKYFRPHALERLRTRAYQKGIWGHEEEKWEHHPLLHPLKAVFGSDEWKYHYEMEHQHDRPAPLSSTYGEDVPFIGPLVAATVGKLLKPRKYIRPEEWVGEDGYRHLPGEEEPEYELGGLPPGAPVAPEEGSQLFNELMYRRREAVGLVGFAEGVMQEAITGREEYFPNKTTMETMGEETSSEYWLWKHLNLGGALGMSEPIRRFIPHERRYLEKYNPLEREMPSWMPEDYFVDLGHGNPMEKIPEAEIRLAGPGYSALHPEVRGLSPENYPLAHRLNILGDVAYWSPEYRRTAAAARKALTIPYEKGGISPEGRKLAEQTFEQVQAKKRRRTFDEYRFRDEELSETMLTVRDVLSPRDVLTKELGPTRVSLQGVGAVRGDMQETMAAAREALVGEQIPVITPSLEGRRYDMTASGPRMKGVAMLNDVPFGAWMAEQGLTEPSPLEDEFEQLQYSAAEQTTGRMWEQLSRAVETPFEALTPLSPAAKLIRKRSAIEEYAKTEAIGTEASFWNKPLENFLLPAIEEMEYAIGDEEIPGAVQQRRATQEYFDMLEWEKQRRVAATAETSQERAKALALQRRTMFGMDPFGRPGDVMRALPRSARDFFQAFSQAQTLEDREEILSLVSQQERRAYLAQWMRQQQVALEAKRRARLTTRQDAMALNKILMARQSEGYGYTQSDLRQWEEETRREVAFDDWLRQKKAQEYWDTHSLPGADWIGFHPSVDLEDVQARYLQHEGLDHHDFDIWGDKVRSLARKPYIGPEAVQQLEPSERLSEEDIARPAIARRNMRTLQDSFGGQDARIEISNVGAPGVSRYNIDVRDERSSLVERTMREFEL